MCPPEAGTAHSLRGASPVKYLDRCEVIVLHTCSSRGLTAGGWRSWFELPEGSTHTSESDDPRRRVGRSTGESHFVVAQAPVLNWILS
jgi:hypothetical protein